MESSAPTGAGGLVRRRRLRAARRTLRRLVLRRRRLLAGGLAAAAVGLGLHVLAPAAAPTVPVTVAARDLPGGTVLAAADLSVADYPADLVPDGVASDPVGRTLAAPVRRGEPVSDRRLVGPGLTSGRPGQVAMPVRFPDAASVALLRVGDRIGIVTTDLRDGVGTVLVSQAPVLALPPESTPEQTGRLPGRLVVVEVPESVVTRLSAAAARGLLTLVISR